MIKETVISQSLINKINIALNVLQTVGDPVSLEEKMETGHIQEAVVFDVEKDFIRKSELGLLRASIRKGFNVLTPEEVEAVQESFGLDIVKVSGLRPHSALSPHNELYNTVLLASAILKLRSVPAIRELHTQRMSGAVTSQSADGIGPISEVQMVFPSQSLEITPERTEVADENASVSATAKVIPDRIIEKVRLLKQGRQGRHGGLNNSQICKTLGITREELDYIMSLPKQDNNLTPKLEY